MEKTPPGKKKFALPERMSDFFFDQLRQNATRQNLICLMCNKTDHSAIVLYQFSITHWGKIF